MPSNHTGDAARIARALKGIDGRLSDLEADVRGRDDPVHVLRQARLQARTFVHGCSIRVYNASDVVTNDWDDLSRQDKRIETFDYSPERVITRDYRTTTDAYHDYLEAAMGRDGATPATALHVGEGDPAAHDPGDRDLQERTGSVPIAAGVYSGGYRDQGAATLSTLINYDELVGHDLREVGVSTTLGDDLIGLAGFDTGYTKARDEVVTVRFNIGVEDISDGAADGVLTDDFALWAGLLLTPTGLERGPVIGAEIGTGTAPLATDSESLDRPVDEVPVTDSALFATDGFSDSDVAAELTIIAYVDAAVAVDEELTEMGLVTDAGPTLSDDNDGFVTVAEIDPSVERSTLENLSLETIIELTHE